MNTFIVETSNAGAGIRVAVKDIIDMAGYVTTVGCRAVADSAVPAQRDAECLAGLRAAEHSGSAQIVGRTNLHELAFGLTGVNPWFGTPTNPLDPTLIPGGSSSGSAVAVASGVADLAYGTDTGGSVRIPAACCGVAGLKTSWGRIPLEGTWPLAPSMDTVGPLARDVAGLVAAMALLEPGFAVATDVPTSIGRLRLPADPAIDAAIDAALAAADLATSDISLPGWEASAAAGAIITAFEGWQQNAELLRRDPDGIDPLVFDRISKGASYGPLELAAANRTRAAWRAEVDEVFRRTQIVALPTLTGDPVKLDVAETMYSHIATRPINVAGIPAVSIPIPRRTAMPASLQLMGPMGSEALLLAAASRIEAAVHR